MFAVERLTETLAGRIHHLISKKSGNLERILSVKSIFLQPEEIKLALEHSP